MKIGDTADRYTIARLKVEHGLQCRKELEDLKQEVTFVNKELLEQLYTVNKIMWDIEVKAEKETNLVRLGVLFKEQRKLNKERVSVKNQINANSHDTQELKKYT